MSLVLGIDTGGTYTDGVVVEPESKKIITKAKALTTREDLSVGIRNCINNLDFQDFYKINVISLSTTLATNAIVEGRGCEVGLLMIGHEPMEWKRFQQNPPSGQYLTVFSTGDLAPGPLLLSLP
jgi:N-methylhydantoinase A/oxoprolinase/acetone carboxylase beta subunit